MDNILSAIESSQHCQRNWDLDKTISPEHLSIFEYVLKNAPSKQNIAYYKVHFIFNRELIENIYTNTPTYSGSVEERYNPQVLANLLVVFEDYFDFSNNENIQIRAYKQKDKLTDSQRITLENNLTQDRLHAIGIASGQLVLVANYLGYKTGFCKCFKPEDLSKVININNKVSLMVGIGYQNINVPHNIHQLKKDYSCKLLPKVNIPISTIY